MLGGKWCKMSADHPKRERVQRRQDGVWQGTILYGAQLYTWQLINVEVILNTWLKASSLNNGSWLCWNWTYLQSVLFSFMFNTHKNNADSEKKMLYRYQEENLPGCP